MSATSPAPGIIVVDANLAVWAVLPLGPGANVINRFAEWRQQAVQLVVPTLWLAECVSAIRATVHSGAFSTEEGQSALDDLFALELEIRSMTAAHARAAYGWAQRLGQAKAYDGFYLALAEELGAEFWTADKRINNAALQAGVTWLRLVERSMGLSTN